MISFTSAKLSDATDKWYIATKDKLVHYGHLGKGMGVRTGFPSLKEYTDRDAWVKELDALGIDPDASDVDAAPKEAQEDTWASSSK